MTPRWKGRLCPCCHHELTNPVTFCGEDICDLCWEGIEPRAWDDFVSGMADCIEINWHGEQAAKEAA